MNDQADTATTSSVDETEETGSTIAVADIAQSLVQALEAAGSAELERRHFEAIVQAAFRSQEGVRLLRKHLDDWNSVSSTFSSRSQANVLEGFALFLLGDYRAAEEILAKEKKTPWGSYYHVETLLARHRKDDAYAAVKGAAEKFPDLLDLAFLRVEVCCKVAQEEEASAVLKGLEGELEDTADYQYHKGLLLERTSEYEEALACYRRATELDAHHSNAHFRLGFCLDLYGQGDEETIDEAISAYENCLRITPPHTNAVINLGILYEDRERYHDAIKCFESVLSFYPNHQRARLFLEDAQASTRMFYDKEEEKKADRHSQVLKIPVTDFELSVRSRNCLAKMNIVTLGDLIQKSEQELLSYKNFGETSLKEIKDMLTQKGLRLGQGLEKPGTQLDEPRNPLEATADPDLLSKPIEELDLSVRSRRCMERLGIQTLRDLINKTEVQLMAAKNFGMTSLNEIKRKLAELGLKLRST